MIELHIRKISAASPSPKIDKDMTHLKSWRDIPGPSTLPLIGQAHHFLPGGEFHNLSMNNIWEKMYEQYGPISKFELALTPPTILLTDPDSIQQVYHAENNMPRRPGFFSLDYYRRHYKKTKREPPLVGLVTDYGEPWKNLRSMVNHILLQPNVVIRYSNAVNDIARDMVQRLKSLRNENNMIPDVDSHIKLWALETTAFIATGCHIKCYDENEKENSLAGRLPKILEKLFGEETIFIDFVMPFVWKYLPNSVFQQNMKIYEDLERIAQHFISLGIDELKKHGDINDGEKSVLEKLLDKDEEVALVMTCDMIVGGFHAVTTTVISILYLLAINQDKQQKLRESLTSNEPKTYLKACIKEALRLMPLSSTNARIITKDHNILGYKVPKDAVVITYHDKLISHENQYLRPGEFIPERWIVGKEDPLHHGNAHPFASLPFGFGVRSCIGRRVAELELEVILYHLIENLSVEWHGPPPVVKRTHLNSLQGLCFVFNDVKM